MRLTLLAAGLVALLLLPFASSKSTDDQTYDLAEGEYMAVDYEVSGGRGYVTLEYAVTTLAGEPILVALLKESEFTKYEAGDEYSAVAGSMGSADPDFSAKVDLRDEGTYVMILENTGAGPAQVRVVDTILDASDNKSSPGAAALPAILLAGAVAWRRLR